MIFINSKLRRNLLNKITLFSAIVMVFNMSFSGVFLFTKTASANTGGIPAYEKECTEAGFDYAVAKWECGDCGPSSWVNTVEITPGTSVTGDCSAANWEVGGSGASGIITKAGNDSVQIIHGSSGIVSKVHNNFSHITFCGNNEEPVCGNGKVEGNEQCDDGNSDNLDECSNSCITQECALELTKTADLAEVNPGGLITYTLALTNSGTAKCTGGGVKLHDNYDSQTTFISATSTPSYEEPANNLVMWNFGTMLPGDSEEVIMAVKVDDEADCQSIITNSAHFWSDQTGFGEPVKAETKVICHTPTPVCGDGNIDTSEECDDGNIANGDGCSANCTSEIPTCDGADYQFEVHANDDQSDDMWVVGHNCWTPGGVITNRDQDFDSINVPVAARYLVKGIVYRGNPGQSQTNESFYMSINGDNGAVASDDTDPNAITSRLDNLGEFNFNSGNNDVYMNTAAQCPPDTHANSVELHKLCLYYIAECGNGIKDAGEQCDDGNNVGGDGCSATCETEHSDPVCGDGTVNQTSEQCDNGANNGLVCTAGYGGSCSYCSNTCQEITITGPYCGDGVKNGSEECDDGNSIDGDNCKNNCTLPCGAPVCGDGSVDAGEECDDGNNTSADGCSKDCIIEPLCSTGAKIKFDFSNIENSGAGNMTSNVYVGPTSTMFAEGSWIDLTKNGYMIVDNGLAEDVPGLAVERGPGWIYIVFYGGHIPPGNWERAYGTLSFDNSLISGFENVSVDNQGDGIYADSIGQDEIYWAVGSSTSDFYMKVKPDKDSYYIKYTCEIPEPICGDGVVNQESEKCDNGANNGLVCTAGYGGSCSYCSNTCQEITITGPYCGDGVKNGSEQCDDSNANNGDGCSATCTNEPGSISGCKYNDVNNNGKIDQGEVKLDNWEIQLIGCPYPPATNLTFLPISNININLTAPITGNCSVIATTTTVNGCYSFVGLSAGSYGVSEAVNASWTQTYPSNNTFYYFPLASGEATSTIDFANHINPYCGDGIKNGEEQCDGSQGVGEHQTCTSQCTLTNVPYCGDGAKNGQEQCDDGNTNNGDGCSATCQTESSEIFCGDGIVNGQEACDNGTANGIVCSLTGYGQSCSYCSNICQTINIKGPYCGDGVVNGSNEQCDGNDNCTPDCKYGTQGGGGGSVYIAVLGESGEPVLTIDKTVNMQFANAGDEVEYSVVLKNTGNLDLLDVKLKDVLPAGFKYSADGKTTRTWDIGDIKSGENKTITYKAIIGENVASGIYANIAEAAASNFGKVSDITNIEVRAVEVLGAEFAETGFSIGEFLILVSLALLSAGMAIGLKKRYKAT